MQTLCKGVCSEHEGVVVGGAAHNPIGRRLVMAAVS